MSIAVADSSIAKVFASPNHGERATGITPEMVILHYTGMPDAKSALKWMCTPESSVSSHYLVYESGKVLQLVPEGRRAWHAGAGSWRGRDDINSRSIGIEIVNAGHEGCRVDPDDPRKPLAEGVSGPLPPFPEKQIRAVIALVKDICARNGIPPRNVLAHSDIAPGRKRDPGEAFPWQQLADEGLGLWVAPAPIRSGHFWQRGDAGEPVKALQTMLAMLGYGLTPSGTFDEETMAAVTAFQRHWRPARVDGVADYSTITTLRDLLRAAG